MLPTESQNGFYLYFTTWIGHQHKNKDKATTRKKERDINWTLTWYIEWSKERVGKTANSPFLSKKNHDLCICFHNHCFITINFDNNTIFLNMKKCNMDIFVLYSSTNWRKNKLTKTSNDIIAEDGRWKVL